MKKFFILSFVLIASMIQSSQKLHKSDSLSTYSNELKEKLKLRFLVHEMHLAVRLYDFSLFSKTIEKIEEIEKIGTVLKMNLKHFVLWHVDVKIDWQWSLKEFLELELEKEIQKLSFRCWFTNEPASYFFTPEMVKELTAKKLLLDGKKATASDFFSEEVIMYWRSELTKIEEYLKSLSSE